MGKNNAFLARAGPRIALRSCGIYSKGVILSSILLTFSFGKRTYSDGNSSLLSEGNSLEKRSCIPRSSKSSSLAALRNLLGMHDLFFNLFERNTSQSNLRILWTELMNNTQTLRADPVDRQAIRGMHETSTIASAGRQPGKGYMHYE